MTDPLHVLYATERSSLAANIPTGAEIDALFRLAAAPVAGRVQWIGPTPRIVRSAATGNVTTHAAWLVRGSREDVAAMLQPLNERLQGNSRDWSIPTAQDYAPGLHGLESWWSSGQAARTRTRDMAPGLLERLSPADAENPLGPDVSGGVAKWIPWAVAAALGFVWFTSDDE